MKLTESPRRSHRKGGAFAPRCLTIIVARVAAVLLLVCVMVFSVPFSSGSANSDLSGLEIEDRDVWPRSRTSPRRFTARDPLDISKISKKRMPAAASAKTRKAAAFPGPVVVGVHTRPITERRTALRSTWFPGSAAEHRVLLLRDNVIARFVIGVSETPIDEAAVKRETKAYGDIMRVNAAERYDSLVVKTSAFFEAAMTLFPNARYVVKADGVSKKSS
jgi:hypothetical protein